jgi:Asp-tRNA(Asn)/Glu-tRNA(Gln) amidotransferase A subunit family amidase
VAVDRRRFLAAFAALGAGGTSLADALWAQTESGRSFGRADLAAAERLAGLELTDAERDLALEGLEDLRSDYETIRATSLDNGVPPALVFDPSRFVRQIVETAPDAPPPEDPVPAGPFPAVDGPEDLAYLTVAELSRLLADGAVTSTELTRLALDRLRRYDPLLQAVVSLTEERALEQAARADAEIAAGERRGPLHGIPWGVKDLMAVPGAPTTWGAKPYATQERPELAAVVERLDDAGAVLVAKLSVGALAWGDVWFGGRTNNPWNPEQGSSGSSAGPAAAMAAGLVPFTLGTETYGSIVSPSTRCGVTGLRPTFGRVSRFGCMALSWSMDKVGPICRTAHDASLVLEAIAGPDRRDPATADRPYRHAPAASLRGRRVGWVPALYDAELPEDAPEVARDQRRLDLAVLDELRAQGAELVPFALDLPGVGPDGDDVGALSLILSAEAAAAFDELTRSGRDDELTRQIANAWPNVLRQARFIPAVEYLQANRIRTGLVSALEERFDDVQADCYVTPTFGSANLLVTNLTGHPMISVPNGFRSDGTPGSFTVTGRLFGERALVEVAHGYQRAAGWHRRRPDLDGPLSRLTDPS